MHFSVCRASSGIFSHLLSLAVAETAFARERLCALARTANAHAAAVAETLSSASSTLASLAPQSEAPPHSSTDASSSLQSRGDGSDVAPAASQPFGEGDLATLRVCTRKNGSRWLLGSGATGQVCCISRHSGCTEEIAVPSAVSQSLSVPCRADHHDLMLCGVGWGKGGGGGGCCPGLRWTEHATRDCTLSCVRLRSLLCMASAAGPCENMLLALAAAAGAPLMPTGHLQFRPEGVKSG